MYPEWHPLQRHYVDLIRSPGRRTRYPGPFGSTISIYTILFYQHHKYRLGFSFYCCIWRNRNHCSGTVTVNVDVKLKVLCWCPYSDPRPPLSRRLVPNSSLVCRSLQVVFELDCVQPFCPLGEHEAVFLSHVFWGHTTAGCFSTFW